MTSSTLSPPVDPEIRGKQLSASSPDSSAWVSANAGSGKTYVLVQRVVRLLLSGCDPSRILCLTFTKAAAGEMANRVFAKLGEWTSLDDTDLSAHISELEGSDPSVEKLSLARTLFAKALETPGGLKIQTIHAFCEALLHRFPLEADIASRFSVIDDREQSILLDRARRLVLHDIATDTDSDLTKSYEHLIGFAGDLALEDIVAELIARREELSPWLDSVGGTDGSADWSRQSLGFSATDTVDDIHQQTISSLCLSKDAWQRLYGLAIEDGGKRSVELAEKIKNYLQSDTLSGRIVNLQSIFLTQLGDIRSFTSYPAKSIYESMPSIRDDMHASAHSFMDGLLRAKTLSQIIATHHLFIYGSAIMDSYRRLKRSSGVLDYDDLVARTVDLLKRQDACAWVLYKLDPSLDHILLDEAQDTNPRQWDIVNQLTEEFFAGKGARDTSDRSLFVVGDEKQSIYSFQGVRPETFSDQLHRLDDTVRLERVSLNQSFRSARSILEAVDTVFCDEENAEGLGLDIPNSPLHHFPYRSDRGSVEVWDLFPKHKDDFISHWDRALLPYESQEQSPAALLATSVATRIKDWITSRHPITTKDGIRAVHAGDFLILVRMRDEFFSALVRALKNFNIPVSGEDRLVLSRHIAVQDLLALGRVLITPNDNLSLASLLKSPLFNFSEDDIAELCIDRGSHSVWHQLQFSDSTQFKDAFIILSRWQRWAHDLPTYEFYARVLGEGGGRRLFYSRLGQESEDILNSFLDMAIDHGKSGLMGLMSFLEDMSLESLELKREWGEQQDQVRIMSVHGAKGLEAPVVFVVDKSGSRGGSGASRLHEYKQDDSPSVYLWAPTGSDEGDISKQIKDDLRKDSDDEYRRLLYVAMTRARDHLIVCGYKTGSGDSGPTWHSMVHRTLSSNLHRGDSLSEADDVFVHHWVPSGDAVMNPALSPDPESDKPAADTRWQLPSWIHKPVADSPPDLPINPSSAGDNTDDFPDIPSILSSDSSTRSIFARGNAVHKLLEFLPNSSSDDRWHRASSWLESQLPDFSSNERDSILSSVRDILDNPSYSVCFDSSTSRPEVHLTGTIIHRGVSVPVEGIVDRLAILEDELIVLDYKSNVNVPSGELDIPVRYGVQMALYRSLLLGLYPNFRARFVLLWTSGSLGSQWMELSSSVLDNHLDDLDLSSYRDTD